MLASKKPSINSRSALLVIFFLETCSGALLDLNAGFNISVRAALDSYGRVIKAHSAADGHAFFVPFLSSPTFESSSTNVSVSLGFALGFLFLNGRKVTASLAIDRQELEDGIYLAVCAGMQGNYFDLIQGKLPNFLKGVLDAEVNVTADGYVVPVWIAKVEKPLRSVNGSLVIVKTQVGSIVRNELQLQDTNSRTELLTVSNTSMMEMKDSGNLVVWDSKNKTYPIFDTDSEGTNTLVQGKKLLVGKQLTSTNGDYSAQMKAGGLVLIANKSQLVAGQPSPYWIFPIHFRNNTYNSNGDVLLNSSIATSMNDLIASSPCASSSADDEAFGMLGMASLQFFLEAGSCSKDPSFHGAQRASIAALGRAADFSFSWSFLKIENDGRLYINAVINNNSTVLAGTPATVRYAFDSEESVFSVEGSVYNRSIAIRDTEPFIWGGCDVPMACGPLGICTTQTSTVYCSCPSSEYFSFIDQEDFSQGCQPLLALPDCNTYNEQFVEFLPFEASSIFLLDDWKYALLSSYDVCQSECSWSCSCIGFFVSHQETGKCLLIWGSEISFIKSAKSFRVISFADLYTATNVSTESYTTYLKVTSDVYGYSGGWATMAVPLIITIGPSVFTLLIVACCCCGYCFRMRRRRRRRQRSRLVEEEELRDILPLLPSRISYKELQAATNGFGKLLGAGGCGSVYSGVLSDGRKVAVKQLDSLMMIGGQSKQLLAEVATVGRTNHLNVVRLVGFCWEDSHRLLVYEFVEKGSLDQWLFIKDSASVDHNGLPASVFDWPTRYNIAVGIARGLSYLHEDCEPPVLHFDIKPQNILLDETFVAKLADFGMSRLMQRGLSRVVTDVRGTPGYIAPEWFAHGAVSKKSDVYSMGMVLLEIVGGRKNVDLALLDTDPLNAAWHFPSWAANKCEEGLWMEIVDEHLHTCGFNAEQAEKLIRSAFWCIQDDPSLRPYALTVLQWLEGDSCVEKPPFKLISTAAHAKSGSFTSWS